MSHAILVDLTLCAGCGACTTACQQVHHFPEKENPTLDDKNFTSIRTVTEKDSGNEYYIRKMCRHCEEPACASACLVGALTKTRDGAVTWDTNKCIGCRYCMLACPFDIPKYEWSSMSPKVRKCTMCYQERNLSEDMDVDDAGYVLDASGERLVIEGREITVEDRDAIIELTTNMDGNRASACSVACPMEATVFGERDQLLAEAKRRIIDSPDDYVPRIYGQKEVGGTSVFYLSNVSFESLGFYTNLENSSYPEKTWRVLEKIPDIVVTAGVALGAVYWITSRREDVKRYEEEIKSKRSKKKS